MRLLPFILVCFPCSTAVPLSSTYFGEVSQLFGCYELFQQIHHIQYFCWPAIFRDHHTLPGNLGNGCIRTGCHYGIPGTWKLNCQLTIRYNFVPPGKCDSKNCPANLGKGSNCYVCQSVFCAAKFYPPLETVMIIDCDWYRAIAAGLPIRLPCAICMILDSCNAYASLDWRSGARQ